ncbi:MAG: hypothetical protein NTZ56_21005 [Acidobacteria bacterium]|nr:hypothetical protein [Acidobacteriota bacterium]
MAELQNHDEQLARAYLLGKLTETERLGVEQRYFTEDDFFLQISSLEEEMIRDFVRGELPASDIADFERRMAEAPDLARKVTLERALVLAVQSAPVEAGPGRSAGPSKSAPPSLFDWLRDLFRRPWPAYSLAAAAMVIAVAATMFWSRENRALRQELAELSTSKRKLEVQLAQATPAEIALPLNSDQVRGEATSVTAPGVLRLSPANRGAIVRLEVELRGPSFPRYQATLRTMNGVEVQSQALARAGSTVWVFSIPEIALRSERYRLDVQGIPDSGAPVELPSAPFAVVRAAPVP